MKKKLIPIVLIVVLLAAAGGAGYVFLKSKQTAKPATAAMLSTEKAARADIRNTVPASGSFQPGKYQTVRPDATMPTRKVVKVYMKARDTVTKGQALAEVDKSGLYLDVEQTKNTLDSAKYKLAELKGYPKPEEKSQAESDMQQAQLDLTLKTTAYESAKKLFDSQYASKSELQTAEKSLRLAEDTLKTAQYKYKTVMAGSTKDTIMAQEAAVVAAQTAYDEARLIYDSTIIRAPMSGTVASVSIVVGDLVSASSSVNGTTSLMTIADLDTMILKAQVDETDIGLIAVGQKALVKPAVNSGTTNAPQSVEGTVTEIDAVSDSTSTSVTVFKVSIAVPNKDKSILWGMNGDVEIVVGEAKDALTVPSSSIQTVNGQKTVTVMRNGMPTAQVVTTGLSDGENTQILDGIMEGDEVVVTRQARKASTTATTIKQTSAMGFGGMGGGGGPGGPPPQ